MFEDFIDKIDNTIGDRSGTVFYSGRSAFSTPPGDLSLPSLYVLGLNPGGDPHHPDCGTIAASITEFLAYPEDAWSAYKDAEWEKRFGPGGMPMQRRVWHVLSGLGRDARSIPASNVVFVRSKDEENLSPEKKDLLPVCWHFHDAVIKQLSIRVVLCLGSTAGEWVRNRLGAHESVGTFVEDNNRRWTSSAYKNSAEQYVLTLPHPSRADWTARATDPTPFVHDMLANV
ncbi:MAG: hypothetical protein JO264_08135 [Acidisphaera sp.]|nr:hypothetical protein [Acidisphaera sp.]